MYEVEIADVNFASPLVLALPDRPDAASVLAALRGAEARARAASARGEDAHEGAKLFYGAMESAVRDLGVPAPGEVVADADGFASVRVRHGR